MISTCMYGLSDPWQSVYMYVGDKRSQLCGHRGGRYNCAREFLLQRCTVNVIWLFVAPEEL